MGWPHVKPSHSAPTWSFLTGPIQGVLKCYVHTVHFQGTHWYSHAKGSNSAFMQCSYTGFSLGPPTCHVSALILCSHTAPSKVFCDAPTWGVFRHFALHLLCFDVQYRCFHLIAPVGTEGSK